MHSCWMKFVSAAVLGVTLGITADAQTCVPGWSDEFPSGIDGVVHCSVVFDEDATGPGAPALFLGGNFETAGGVAAQRIVRWDGNNFTPLSTGITGSSVFALTVFDADGDGPGDPALYVAGNFNQAGGMSAANVARWNGSTWSNLNFGLGGTAYALAGYDADGDGPIAPALYAAGLFTTADGLPARHIAHWNGASWEALGEGLNDFAYDLASYDPDDGGPLNPSLYAVGAFTTADDLDALFIARWDGAAWWPLQTGPTEFGFNGRAYCLKVFDSDASGPGLPRLYVGGTFTFAGSVPAQHIVSWDGSGWSAVGVGVNDDVWALTSHDEDGDEPNVPALFAGGGFTTAGGAAANYVARWHGGAWTPVSSGLNATVRTLTSFDDSDGSLPPALYAGGEFTAAGATASGHVARWGCPPENEAPSIIIQPESLVPCEGDVAQLTVWATGTPPLSYQWYKDDELLVGATGQSFTITSAGPGDVGTYDVIVTNSIGSTTSAPATVDLGIPPSITLQPQSTATCKNWAAVMQVEAEGTGPLTYQWYHNGEVEYGEVSPTFTIHNAQLSDVGQYTVIVTGKCGSVTSDPAQLSVGLGPFITEQPQGGFPCTGESHTFCVTVLGETPPVFYKWYKDGMPINGADAACYTIESVTMSDTGQYSVRVDDACAAVQSAEVTLAVVAGPVIEDHPASQTACIGGAATFCVTLSEGAEPLTYEWYKDDVLIAGAPNDACLVIDPVESGNAGTYRVSISNFCGAVDSQSATLTLAEAPTISANPVDDTVCVGDAATFCVTLAGGTPPLTYEWLKNGVPVSGAPNDACFTIPSADVSDAGQYSVAISNDCGSVTSVAAEFVVELPPVIGSGPADATICAGETVEFCVTVSGGTAPFAYAWYKDGERLSGADEPCLSIPASDAGEYSVHVSNDCGSVASSTATLTVRPLPTIDQQPGDLTVCVGGNATFCVTLDTGTPPYTYEWHKDGAPIVGAPSSFCYSIASVSLADEGEYSVVVTDTCGSVVSADATLTVGGTPQIVSDPVDQLGCVGFPATFCVDVMERGVPLVYSWLKDGTPINDANEACYTINSVSPSDVAAYSVEVSSICGSAVSAAATLTLGTAPQIGQDLQNQTVVLGDTVEFCVDVIDGTPPLSYTWYHDGQPIAGAPDASCFSMASAGVADAGDYAVAVSNACATVFSATATLTVAEPPTIDDDPVAETVCAGDAATFCVTLAGGTPPLTFTWWRDGAVISGAPNADCLTIDPVDLVDAGAYSVQISSGYGSVVSTSAVLTVNDCPPPATPGDPNPANGAANVTVNVAMQWSAVANADEYDVYFGTSATPPLVVTQTDTNWSPSTLQYGQRYHWQIVAVNAFGSSASPMWTFTTMDAPLLPPGMPSGPSPADGATEVAIDVELDWNNAPRSNMYTVRFGQSTAQLDELGTTAASGWSLDELTYGTVYFWQVVAENAAGSVPGPVWSFETMADPNSTPPDDEPNDSGPPDPNTSDPNDVTRPTPSAGVCPSTAVLMLTLTVVAVVRSRPRRR